jgi:hypothetical protein
VATWAPLRELLGSVSDSITLTWNQLDDLVGGLPPSATQYREFWAGDRSGWPGFRTKNVQIGKQVTFERAIGSASSLTQPRRGEGSIGVVVAGAEDELVLRAAAATGIADRAVLVREGLETLIRLASARKLAALGGTDPAAAAAPRRRTGAA